MIINILVVIYYILFFISFVFGAYFAITGLFGFRNMHKKFYDEHDPKYKFAILIPSRNEEEVIGGIVDSLKKQNYPKKLYDIYVVPNNCTDDTEGAAKKAGAKIIRCNTPVKVKADAINIALNELKDKDYDCYTIFDSDNLVHPDFLKKTNNALCEGKRVTQCFRDAKNGGYNWITGSYTLFYFVQNFFFNRARMNIGGSAAINGTGFTFMKDVVKDGFNTVTLTEDSEFTGQMALRGIQVGFIEDAITYDEHPQDFWSSWKQRKRWTSGTIQCFQVYGKSLIKEYFKTGRITCLDMFMTYLAPIALVLSFFLMIVLCIFYITGVELFDFFSYLYAWGIFLFIGSYIVTILLEIFILRYNKKEVGPLMSGVIFFAFFIITWIPINIICMVKKTEKWEEIKHSRGDVGIDNLVN